MWLGIVQIQRNGQVSWCQANALVTAGLHPYCHVKLACLFQRGGLFFIWQQPDARTVVVHLQGGVTQHNVTDPAARVLRRDYKRLAVD